ncbi:hypothetical protein LCGC14_2469450, partial [marine sediment metagenome]
REVFKRLARREFEKGDDAPHKKVMAYGKEKRPGMAEEIHNLSERTLLKKTPFATASQKATETAQRKNHDVFLVPNGGGYYDVTDERPASGAFTYVSPDGTMRTAKEAFDCQITPEAAEMAEGDYMLRLNGSIVCRGGIADLNHFAAAKSLKFEEGEGEFGGMFVGEGIELTPEHRIPVTEFTQRKEALGPKLKELDKRIAQLEQDVTDAPLSNFVVGLRDCYGKLISYHSGDRDAWTEGKVLELSCSVLKERLPERAAEIESIHQDLLGLVSETEVILGHTVEADEAVVTADTKSTVIRVIVKAEHPKEGKDVKRALNRLIKDALSIKATGASTVEVWLLSSNNEAAETKVRFALKSAGVRVKYVEADEGPIDQAAVTKPAMDAAQDIHGKPDMKIIRSMVQNAIKKGAKDTEDAIQIVINMMRSKEAQEAAQPIGKAQVGLLKWLHTHRYGNISDIRFRDVPVSIGQLQKAAKVLAKKGLIHYVNGTIKLANEKAEAKVPASAAKLIR